MELIERNRFSVLACLHRQAGGSTELEFTVDLQELSRTLQITRSEIAQAISFLIHASYLAEPEPGRTCCLTRRAIYYLEAGAFQRRTIRD